MRDAFREVLALQSEWTNANSPAMERRGQLIRTVIPAELRNHLEALGAADFSVQGRDGTGRKTEIPWIRLYDPAASPNARTGWYLVYLVDAYGTALHLSLNQGTTDFIRGEFTPKDPAVLASRVSWARKAIGLGLADPIELPTRASDLGHQYEQGHVCGVTYPVDSLPDDAQLLSDLRHHVDLLVRVYREEATVPPPGTPSPEVQNAIDSVHIAAQDRTAGRPRLGGRRFGRSAAQNRAVEGRAVKVATERMTADGWVVEDVGASRSYDLHCTRADEVLRVEVKGTTGLGDGIVLTRNEVALHIDAYPHNALAVVTGIQLGGTTSRPTAGGGSLQLWQPWELRQDALIPLAYEYRLTP